MSQAARISGIAGWLLVALVVCGNAGDGCTFVDKCAEADCPGDLNECTSDCDRSTGRCRFAAVSDGRKCYDEFPNAICVSGVCVENPCGEGCNDRNECTSDRCNYDDGTCEYVRFGPSWSCRNGWWCQEGSCEILADQCTAEDLALAELGFEPDLEALGECAEAGRPSDDIGNTYACVLGVSECLQGVGTALSSECSTCFTLRPCCLMHRCGCEPSKPEGCPEHCAASCQRMEYDCLGAR